MNFKTAHEHMLKGDVVIHHLGRVLRYVNNEVERYNGQSWEPCDSVPTMGSYKVLIKRNSTYNMSPGFYTEQQFIEQEFPKGSRLFKEGAQRLRYV